MYLPKSTYEFLQCFPFPQQNDNDLTADYHPAAPPRPHPVWWSTPIVCPMAEMAEMVRVRWVICGVQDGHSTHRASWRYIEKSTQTPGMVDVS